MTSIYRDQRGVLNSHELMDTLLRAEVAHRKSRVILSLLDMYRELGENINFEAIEEDCKTRVESLSEDEVMERIQQTKRQLERYRVPIILFDRFNNMVSACGV